MKLRLPGRRDRTEAAPDPSADLTSQLVRTGGKGRPTPKRHEAQGRRPGPPPPPPRTRKEAWKRMREQQATTGRGATRAGTARSDEAALPARDRGPVRKLVRDVVDARRNAGSFFLLVAALVLLGNFLPEPVRSYSVSLWLVFFAVMILDSVVLGRRIKTTVLERFPGQDHRMKSLVWYGITRATMVRRWRFPKATVPLGAKP